MAPRVGRDFAKRKAAKDEKAAKDQQDRRAEEQGGAGATRCPDCGTEGAGTVKRDKKMFWPLSLFAQYLSSGEEETFYRCRYCGHEWPAGKS